MGSGSMMLISCNSFHLNETYSEHGGFGGYDCSRWARAHWRCASVGGCDEFLKFCLYEKVMSKEKIEELEGKCTGNIEEGEQIKLKIVPLNKLAETCPDMKTLTALYLYRRIQINRNREDIIREMEDETLRLKPLPNKL